MSLNINENIILAADPTTRLKVANWFADECKDEKEGCFECYKQSANNTRLMMHALDRSPKLTSAVFPTVDSDPEAANAICRKLSQRCRSTLTKVFYDGIRIRNHDISGLLELLHENSELTTLSFERVDRDDAVVRIMQEVKTCPFLTCLDFGWRTTDVGVARISEELGRPGCRIEHLKIGGRGMSDFGFLRLARGIVANGFNNGDLCSVIVNKDNTPISSNPPISPQAMEALVVALYLNPSMGELNVNSIDADFPELQDGNTLINRARHYGLIINDEEDRKVRANLGMPEAAAIPVSVLEQAQKLHKNMDDLARIRKLFEVRDTGISVNSLMPAFEEIIKDLPEDFKKGLDLSRDPEAKLALALTKRFWKDIKVEDVLQGYEMASQAASGFNDVITKEKDLFNRCALLALGIKKDIVFGTYPYTRQEVVNWFTADDKVCDFSYYKGYGAKQICNNEWQLLLAVLKIKPRLQRVVLCGDWSPVARLLRRCGNTPVIEILPLSNMLSLPILLNGNEGIRELKCAVGRNDSNGLLIMEQVKTCKNLKALYFDGYGISDLVAVRISEELMRPGCGLEILDIGQHCITDIGAMYLARGIAVNGFNEGSLRAVNMMRGPGFHLSLGLAKTIEIAKRLNPNISIDVRFERASTSLPKDDDTLIKEAQRLGLIRSSEEEAKARSILDSCRRTEVTKTAEAAAAATEEEVQAPAEKKSKTNEDDHGTTNG